MTLGTDKNCLRGIISMNHKKEKVLNWTTPKLKLSALQKTPFRKCNCKPWIEIMYFHFIYQTYTLMIRVYVELL